MTSGSQSTHLCTLRSSEFFFSGGGGQGEAGGGFAKIGQDLLVSIETGGSFAPRDLPPNRPADLWPHGICLRINQRIFGPLGFASKWAGGSFAWWDLPPNWPADLLPHGIGLQIHRRIFCPVQAATTVRSHLHQRTPTTHHKDKAWPAQVSHVTLKSTNKRINIQPASSQAPSESATTFSLGCHWVK